VALYSHPRNTRVLVVSLVMVSLLTITIDYKGGNSGPFEVAGKGALSVVGAMQSGVSHILRPIGAFFSGLAHVGSLQSENRALKQQVQQLKQQQGRTVSLERRNAELASLLKVEQSLRLEGVGASVIGYSVGNFEWSVTINRGSTSKVRTNDAVVSGDGLVGHVILVAPTTSVVQLIIDPNSAVAGRLSSSGETGLIRGQRDQDLTMDLVSADAKIFPNEQVVTSGYQGGLYPPEILIGQVSHTYQQPGGLTKEIAVRPAVDFSSLEFVFVVTGR
jgi:rod shape-determining protein MreC